MMRMSGSFVCISTLRVFSEVTGSRAGAASGSARSLPFGKAPAVIGRVSCVLTATDFARSAAVPELFLRRG